MTILKNRAVAVLTAAALALTSIGVAPALAASKPAKQAQTAQAAGDYEFSSRRRGRSRDAAGAAAFAAIVGAIATYAAAREYRKAQERRYSYYGDPYYGRYRHQPYGYHHW